MLVDFNNARYLYISRILNPQAGVRLYWFYAASHSHYFINCLDSFISFFSGTNHILPVFNWSPFEEHIPRHDSNFMASTHPIPTIEPAQTKRNLLAISESMNLSKIACISIFHEIANLANLCRLMPDDDDNDWDKILSDSRTMNIISFIKQSMGIVGGMWSIM